jgi:primosomal protein N'
MKTQFYFPAPVEVVKVTNENLADVAAWCGGKVAATESRRVAGRMDSYVWVPTPKGTAISWAFPGMFITKRLAITVKDEMKATYSVFRRDYFSRNFFDTPTEATDKTWEKYEKEKAKESNTPKPAAPKPRATYKSKAEIESEAGTEHLTEAQQTIVNQIKELKENVVETNANGVPELTEEEAKARKKQKADEQAAMAQAVENVQEGIPGSEVIETTDIGGDAFAGGQALDSTGDIEQVSDETPIPIAPVAGSGEDEIGRRAPQDEETKDPEVDPDIVGPGNSFLSN